MTFIIGVIVVLACVVGGYMANGGHLFILWQPFEFVIIVGAAIGGLQVVTAQGWFAARPSGTEDIYKVYAESLLGADHLRRIVAEAQAIVDAALAAPTQPAAIARGMTSSGNP